MNPWQAWRLQAIACLFVAVVGQSPQSYARWARRLGFDGKINIKVHMLTSSSGKFRDRRRGSTSPKFLLKSAEATELVRKASNF